MTTGVSSTTVASRLSTAVTRAATANTPASSRRGSPRQARATASPAAVNSPSSAHSSARTRTAARKPTTGASSLIWLQASEGPTAPTAMSSVATGTAAAASGQPCGRSTAKARTTSSPATERISAMAVLSGTHSTGAYGLGGRAVSPWRVAPTPGFHHVTCRSRHLPLTSPAGHVICRSRHLPPAAAAGSARVGEGEAVQPVGRAGSGVVPALPGVAAQRPQVLRLGPGLDALDGDGQAQPVGHRDDALDDLQVDRVRGLLAHTAGERAVQLEHAEREPAQRGQVGVAGAEVVERDLDAEVGDLPQRFELVLVGADQRALGDLQAQRPGFQTGLVQYPGDLGDQLGVVQLDRREVDVDARGALLAMV